MRRFPISGLVILAMGACSQSRTGDQVADAITMRQAESLAAGLSTEWAGMVERPGARDTTVLILLFGKATKGECKAGFCSWTYSGTIRVDHPDSGMHAIRAQFHTAGSQLSVMLDPDTTGGKAVKAVPFLMGVADYDSITTWVTTLVRGEPARRMVLHHRE